VISDIENNGDADAWRNGEWGKSFASISTNMRYRSGWYLVDDQPRTMFAMGIHGQNLFIDGRTTLWSLNSRRGRNALIMCRFGPRTEDLKDCSGR
jgi:hypothetical protein